LFYGVNRSFCSARQTTFSPDKGTCVSCMPIRSRATTAV